MKYRPGSLGASAVSSMPCIFARPIFCMLPIAFSSMVDIPPAILPLLGWEPRRSTPWESIKSKYDLYTFMNSVLSSSFSKEFTSTCSAPVSSGVSPNIIVAPLEVSRSVTTPTAGLLAKPEVVSDSPHFRPMVSWLRRASSRLRPVA